MNDTSYTHTQTFAQAPEAVFDAIVDTRGWWSGTIDGDASRVGSEFRYRYSNMHDSTQRVTELVRGEKIVWRVLDAHLSFADNPREWAGTEIVFELAPEGTGTRLTFTHVGLRPSCDCYDACSGGWDILLSRNLRARAATGRAQPDAFAPGGRGA